MLLSIVALVRDGGKENNLKIKLPWINLQK